MKKIKYFILVVVSLVIIKTCVYDEIERNLNGGYELDEIDGKENMTLYSEEGVQVVPPTVFAVGQNDEFIIAKQHPRGIRTITYYYIIPIIATISDSPEENVYGPFSETEFNAKKRILGISDLKFTIHFYDLE